MSIAVPHTSVDMSPAHVISSPNAGMPKSAPVMDCHEVSAAGVCDEARVRDMMAVTINAGVEMEMKTVDEFITKMGFTVCNHRGEGVLLSEYMKLVGKRLQRKRELKNLICDMKDRGGDEGVEGVKRSGRGMMRKVSK